MKHMLTRISALFLLLLCIACAGSAEAPIIVDKTGGKNPDFAFAEDAELLEVYFPKIYGVDCAFMRCGSYTMLIDAAGMQWKSAEALLSSLGVTDLTYALNTHPDGDHIGGFVNLLKHRSVGSFLMGFPEDFPEGDSVRFDVYAMLHERGIPMRMVGDGDTIDFGPARISVYQRTESYLPRVNNRSVVLLVEFGARRILFTGDIQATAQMLFVEDPVNYDLKADVLKYPHHAYEPLREAFLERVSPSLVISTGGRIDSKGALQMRKAGIPHLDTGVRGYRLTTDGNVWVVETY